MPPKKKSAGSIAHILKNPISWAKEVISPIPTRLNNISTATLKKYSGYPIQSSFIMRTPLENVWNQAINAISVGEFNKLKAKHGFDKLFHVALVVSVNNTNILIEKNEVINIDLFKKSDIKNQTETYRTSGGLDLTLDQMIDNTLKYMGPERFYSYNAIGSPGNPKNNCQDFVRSILKANNLLTKEAEKFLYQDITPLEKELSSHVAPSLQAITNLGSKVSRLIGKGRPDHPFVDFVMNNGFRLL